MSDTNTLTTVTGLRPWNSTAFGVFQSPVDFIDFRFTMPNGQYSVPLRLLANRDVRIYGEVRAHRKITYSFYGASV